MPVALWTRLYCNAKDRRMTDRKPSPAKPAPASDREDRLKVALKANLAKRKALTRAKSTTPKETGHE